MASKQKTERKALHGFDSAAYRRMSVIFTLLSVINIAAVLFAFMRSGYGLYHAEAALSHAAQIQQDVQSINESTLDIVIHCADTSHILSGKFDIKERFTDLDNESVEYLKIDLSQIDQQLQWNFEDASKKIASYQAALDVFTAELTENVKSGAAEAADYTAKIEQQYSKDIEPLKNDAEESITNLFAAQDKATYDFFVRCAQQFVFVLLFMAITLTTGLVGIHKMKKNAKTAADRAEKEHIKAELSRAKSVNIAYSNILTGFKNRYGLESDLESKLVKGDFTVAMYQFVDLHKIMEQYGRAAVDDFLSNISQTLKRNYSETADIYSTETDEFCFVFKNELSQAHENEIMHQIARALSRAADIDGVKIQSNVAGCYYHCKAGAHKSCNSLLNTLDRSVGKAKQQCIANGQNAVMNIDSK